MSKSKITSGQNTTKNDNAEEEDLSTKPDFIYGGPFIKVEKPSPFLNIATPGNSQLQGTFKRSMAYFSLKERLPVILTKIIDYLSREGAKIRSTHNATDADIMSYIKYITKLKNDLITNKEYDPLTVDTPEAQRWNKWIESADNKHYFTNVWLFSECYVYRRLREGCELCKSLENFDPFEQQKDESFTKSLEPMCIVAEKLFPMLEHQESYETDSNQSSNQQKVDFIKLLKICLWSNKCDLSLSLGDQVTIAGSADENTENTKIIDPFQMIIDFKDKILSDNTAKIYDLIITKAANLAKAIEENTNKAKCTCNTLAANAGVPVCEPPAEQIPEEEIPEIPCPSRMTLPLTVMFDIVCDNAGYEFFTDLCVAHFLIAHEIVKKVRFHVKKFGWFISDVTPRDFKFVISSCVNASYSREIPAPPNPDLAEGEEPPQPTIINSKALQQLGAMWTKFVDDGVFVVMTDDFWTSPHIYKDMKAIAPTLYRQLQFAVAVMFKGDLNYRKLLGERNWNPSASFESTLQGFVPAPLIALRTVKSELICGLPKGKTQQISKIDPNWMQKGDYGVIQCSAKTETMKAFDRPCVAYGEECKGIVCPPPSL